MGDDLRALLFGESVERTPSDSGSLWGAESTSNGNKSLDDLFSEASAPKNERTRKKISDVLREIDTPSSSPARVKNDPLTAINVPPEGDDQATTIALLSIPASSDDPQNSESATPTVHDPLLHPLSAAPKSPRQVTPDPDVVDVPLIEPFHNAIRSFAFESFLVVGMPRCKSVSPSMLTNQIAPKILFHYPRPASLPLAKVRTDMHAIPQKGRALTRCGCSRSLLFVFLMGFELVEWKRRHLK